MRPGRIRRSYEDPVRNMISYRQDRHKIHKEFDFITNNNVQEKTHTYN